MDIGSGSSYPSCALSNFAPHKFIYDGVECASMEGFLQSLKFSSPEMQAHVCTLVGKSAKFKGKKKTVVANSNALLERRANPSCFSSVSEFTDRSIRCT